MSLRPLPQNIALQFRNVTGITGIDRLGSGHIHDTFLVATNSDQFVLQKINSFIFPDIDALTSNIMVVTNHINTKIDSNLNMTLLNSKLELVGCNNGLYYCRDDNGRYWRMFNYITGSQCQDIAPSSDIAYQAARAFGMFQYLLADLPSGSLNIIIPGFHDMKLRSRQFSVSLEKNYLNRKDVASAEIDFANARLQEMYRLQELAENGIVPLRTAHNDAKINNVLFDDKGKALCIIDLDTVMPGTVLFDFGDGIRTCATNAAEDDADYCGELLSLSMFEAYAAGYLYTVGSFLNPVEIENLVFSARYITFIMGLRFLTDYLNGDVYFRTKYENQNLKRARTQFRLVAAMEKHREQMNEIILSLNINK